MSPILLPPQPPPPTHHQIELYFLLCKNRRKQSQFPFVLNETELNPSRPRRPWNVRMRMRARESEVANYSEREREQYVMQKAALH